MPVVCGFLTLYEICVFFNRFSVNATLDIHFGQYTELNPFQVDLNTKMPYIGGHRNTYKALRAADKEFRRSADPRLPRVNQVV